MSDKKMNRTETTTVRLDRRLRYLADIAARKQRISLSSLLYEATRAAVHATLSDADALWDTDTERRRDKLAKAHPELLSYDDEVAYKRKRAVGQ